MRGRDHRRGATAATDPSLNVAELVAAEAHRQDGLRALHEKLEQTRDDHIRELVNVRADANKQLIAANERLTEVRAEYEEKLRVAAARQQEALAAQLAAVSDAFRTTLEAQFTGVNKELASLRESRSATGGHSAGLGQGWQFLVGGVGLLLTLLLIASTVIIIASR